MPKEKKEPIVYFPNDEKLDKTFKDFMQMRKDIKAKMTDRAIELMINKINRLDVDTAIAQLKQSILRSWKDIFPLSENKQQNKTTPQQQSQTDDIFAQFMDMYAEQESQC